MPKNLKQLPKIKESISFIYVERCRIEQDAMAIAKWDKDGGKTSIPIANITCLLLGPGTVITHAAIKAIADCGCSVVWCGEGDTRFYAYGRGETRNGKNLILQARLCMNQELHMKVVYKMYTMRFGEKVTAGLNLNQLRGIEGVRMKKAYALAAKQTGVAWKTRDLGRNKEWNELSPLDKALIHSNKLLYAICSSVIVSMGFSTGLGFIHTGRSESFAYDIADLYKAETTIPASFEAVKIAEETGEDIEVLVRKQCRKYFHTKKLMKRIPKDLLTLFDVDEDQTDEPDSELWNGGEETVKTGSWNLSKLLDKDNADGCNGDGESK